MEFETLKHIRQLTQSHKNFTIISPPLCSLCLSEQINQEFDNVIDMKKFELDGIHLTENGAIQLAELLMMRFID
jgi:hypothetical protein